MREPVLIVWGILMLITAAIMLYVSRRKMRPMRKYAGWQKIGLMILTFCFSWLLFRYLRESPHFIYVGRLVILGLAILDTWVMYKLRFSKRDAFDPEEDSFWLEFLFTLLHGFIAALMFATAPQITNLVDIREVDVSYAWWDIPLIFIIPYLCVKLLDFASQTPYKEVENRWLYPMEVVVIDQARWQDFIQVNFKIKDGMRKEYKFLTMNEKPWIQVPRKFLLGDAFRLNMQERRKDAKLKVINDIGNEHGGSHRFWWIFRKARVWWNPLTWFRNRRYLNPDYSIEANDVRPYDVIIARRIPVGKGFIPGQAIQVDPDEDATILLNR